MRRFTVPILCALAALALGSGQGLAQAGAGDAAPGVAAGVPAGAASGPARAAAPSTAPFSVGIAFAGDSSLAERTLDGFFERMAEIAPRAKTERMTGLADADALGAAVAELAARHDGVIVMRSTGSEWLADHAVPVPAFIAGGTHPPTLGVVMNMDAPEGNVTGVTYFLDHQITMEIFVAMFPQALNWEVFTQIGHPSSPIDAAGVAEACPKLYLNCKVTPIPSGADLPDAIRASDAEAFLIGNQAPLYDDPAVFAQALEAAGDRAVFSLNRQPVSMGAAASMTASDHKLGRMLADRVVAVLRDGKPIREVPVGRDPEPTLKLNAAALERLGIHLPRQMMALSELVGD